MYVYTARCFHLKEGLSVYTAALLLLDTHPKPNEYQRQTCMCKRRLRFAYEGIPSSSHAYRQARDTCIVDAAPQSLTLGLLDEFASSLVSDLRLKT